jgi:hypothetical protein
MICGCQTVLVAYKGTYAVLDGKLYKTYFPNDPYVELSESAGTLRGLKSDELMQALAALAPALRAILDEVVGSLDECNLRNNYTPKIHL